jgi:Cell wall-active antibiotics response 4TMS YvqF
MNGIELKSRSRAFRGGSMFSWLGGIAVDLREVELAENAHIDVHSAFGGIAIRVPTGWRVESTVTSLAGGVAVDVPAPESPDAPTLRLDGFSAFGGIAVGAKPDSAAS